MLALTTSDVATVNTFKQMLATSLLQSAAMKAIVWLAIALGLSGCATNAPIVNVTNAPVVAASGRTLSRTEVARAIQRAGQSMGWQMIADGPGHFTGRLAVRTHVAVVEIEHDARSYSIQYRDSLNLDARDGHIHKGYNQWIENLDKAIRAAFEVL